VVPVAQARNLVSYLTPVKNACFLKHCHPQVMACKNLPSCFAQWMYDFPANGVRPAGFVFKNNTYISAMMNCGHLHWSTINNNCVTQVKPKPSNGSNPFSVPASQKLNPAQFAFAVTFGLSGGGFNYLKCNYVAKCSSFINGAQYGVCGRTAAENFFAMNGGVFYGRNQSEVANAKCSGNSR